MTRPSPNLVRNLATLALTAGTGVFAAAAANAAGSVSFGYQTAGPTPFIAYVADNYRGSSIASVSFTITPKSGSFTRPLTATATAAFLAARGALGPTYVVVPVFGLYAGSNNTVTLGFTFTDGSTAQQVVPISTASYSDPCAQENAPVLQQNRTTTSQLNFDYFILKDYCSVNSPAIFDTDGHIRWVGQANAGSLPGEFYDNGIYTSDTKTGVNRLELYGGVTKIGDYASGYGVTSTNNHNIDVGRNGLVVDVSTNTEDEAAALEIDPASGKVLQDWDMGQIISAAMTAGGDNPSQFVYPDGHTDWFHMNSTAYNPADNTLIVSSRENFVIAVDYDAPASGVRKIHWILGDTTKKWYQFASLRKYALTLAPGGLAPIGQHGISVDSKGDLLLFNDGYGSQFQSPPGITRGYSTADSYAISTATMSATPVYSYDPSPSIYSYICGSAYEAPPGDHLIDFATANNDQTTEIQGLGATNNVVFDLKLSATNYCAAGWNASVLPGTINYQ